MNLLDILKENSEIILTEAININTPEEAYDSIINKKIGAKVVDNGWFKFLPANKEEFLKKFKKIIEYTKDNAAYAFQLAVNKLDPLTFMQTDPRLFSLLVNFKNKEWAKKNEKYKEFINLNNKLTELDYMDLDDLATELENESDNHGKKAKGSGNTKDLEVAYDKDGWALYIPHNWQAAKAASFYGKRGEKDIPCGWCTRADLKWYNHYTDNNTKPLYIIRNYNTGKAYQMAIRDNRFNFLDQDDAMGDEISQGDISKIPDELLKKINYKGISPLDYKNLKKEEKGESKKFPKNAILDPTENVKKAKWGKDIPLGNGIFKQVWENLGTMTNKSSSLEDYMKTGRYIKGENFGRRNGNYAVRYYYKKHPEVFVLFRIEPKNTYPMELSIVGDEKNISKEKMDDLYEIASKDSGYDKHQNKDLNKTYKNMNIDDAYDSLSRSFSKNVRNSVISALKNNGIESKIILKNVTDDITGRYSDPGTEKRGNFIPKKISMTIKSDKGNSDLVFNNVGTKFKIDENSKDSFNQKIINDMENAINMNIIQYYKKALKDKYISAARNEFKYNKYLNSNSKEKSTAQRLQFEDYFPY